MKYHVEFDDFGMYVEAVTDCGEFSVVEECNEGRTVELILFEEGAA